MIRNAVILIDCDELLSLSLLITLYIFCLSLLHAMVILCLTWFQAHAPPSSTSVTPNERGAGAAPGASSAFPRNTRNRQTFHGKTEHTRVSVVASRLISVESPLTLQHSSPEFTCHCGKFRKRMLFWARESVMIRSERELSKRGERASYYLRIYRSKESSVFQNSWQCWWPFIRLSWPTVI